MRLLLYSLNFHPEQTGIGKYSGEMTDWLRKNGIHVDVVSAKPYYPHWKLQPGFGKWRSHLEPSKQGDTWRCPLWVPQNPNGLKRIIHLASFALLSIPSLIRAARRKPDIIMQIEPTLFCTPSTLIAAKIWGCKTWLHVQDLEVDASFSLGLMRSRRAQRLALKIERALLSRIDYVSTISNAMQEKIIAKGVPKEKTSLLPNWVNFDLLTYYEPNNLECMEFLASKGIPQDKRIALYSGNMGNKQGLEILPQTAQLCPNVNFIFCGEGSERPKLEERCKGLANVYLLPLQPDKDFSKLLGGCDIHLLPQLESASDLVMPSKLTNMMASGRPTVAIASSCSSVYTIASSYGIITPPRDTNKFASAITLLAHNKVLRERLGNQANAEAIRAFNKERILENLKCALVSSKESPPT